MMSEQVDAFISGLIRKTNEKCLEWKSYLICPIRRDVNEEIYNGRAGFDVGINSIRESKSYYFSAGEGYVFLFEVFHGDPEVTSPELDTISLMVKINASAHLDDLSLYGSNEQQRLEELRLLVEKDIEEKICYPDDLYKFMEQVIS